MRRLGFPVACFCGLWTAASAQSVQQPSESGIASWYGTPYHGQRSASGEIYDQEKLTAAHRTLPFGTRVRVRRLDTGGSILVRINDRGPFINGRIIDLSLRAARAIDMVRAGVVPVKLKIISQGTVPRRTASGTPLEAVQGGAFENLSAVEDLVVSFDSVDKRATQ